MTLSNAELGHESNSEVQMMRVDGSLVEQLEAVSPPPLAKLGRAIPKPDPSEIPVRSGDTVIGSDISIQGRDLRIVTQGELRVDGDIQGDVVGASIVVGPRGTISGRLFARDAVIEGRVSGAVKAIDVKMTSTANVNGEVLHLSLALESGARFDGRCRKARSQNEILREFADLMVANNEPAGPH